MNAPHRPRPTALWLLTLVVLLAHLWLLKGSLGDFVLSPGSRAPTQPTTVLLQLQPATQRPETSTPIKVASKLRPSKQPAPPSPPSVAAAPSTASVVSETPSTQVTSASDVPTSIASPSDHTQALSASAEVPHQDEATNSIAKDTTPESTKSSGPVITEAGSYPPVAVPGPLKLLYKLQGQAKGFNYSAKGEMVWLPAGQRYEARLEISAFLLGSRVQSSRGEITANGLQPQRFSDKVRSEVAAHFDWVQRKVIFSANTPQADLQNGAQDHLSAFIALASLLGGDLQRYLPDGEIRLQAVGPREADVWRVLMRGEETLDLPAGSLHTYKLNRPPVKPYDLNVELWMAPSLGFLPARIRLTQHNGDYIDQLLQSSGQP